eukprot:TRINITY_DN72436_c0_g1_i1.p1 TRINITY_DN72436_c0_g1~~TRINITY_DN72436_c0_g1_i1.p1  ORF type:complete len:154 (+),score=27.70 TRINITY_DN72436_c0_g1_i1:59-520(+)
MKKTGCIILCCAVGAGAFVGPPSSPPRFLNSNWKLPAAFGGAKADKVTVFDAGEVPVSWDDYKKQKPKEFKLDEVDEMTCWTTDECPVEDSSRFTKAWHVRSAERNPTMETHFDSEGEWEEETKWSKKWHEDVGEDDLHEEAVSPSAKDGFGI